MSGEEFSVGTVGEIPTPLAEALATLGETFGHPPIFKKKMGLAGPNDILHIVLTAELWGMTVPWAVKYLTQGALIAVGQKLANRFWRQTPNDIPDEMATRIAELEASVDRLLGAVEATRTFWGAPWELYFGLDGSTVDTSRAVVALQVASREEAARAVLVLSLLGEEIERFVREFLHEHPATAEGYETGQVYGVPELRDDGSATVTLTLLGNSIERKLRIDLAATGIITVTDTSSA